MIAVQSITRQDLEKMHDFQVKDNNLAQVLFQVPASYWFF